MPKVTKKNKYIFGHVCNVCLMPFKFGESYEHTITSRTSEVCVHTDCIGK